MPEVSCWECRGFAGHLDGRIRVIRVVQHSREAEEGHDVVPCQRCGTLHEIERLNGEEAA